MGRAFHTKVHVCAYKTGVCGGFAHTLSPKTTFEMDAQSPIPTLSSGTVSADAPKLIKGSGWIAPGSDDATGVICTLLPTRPDLDATETLFAIFAPIPERDFRAIARGKASRGPTDWKATVTRVVEVMAARLVVGETYSARATVRLYPSGSDPLGSRLDRIFLAVEFLQSSAETVKMVFEHVYAACSTKRVIYRMHVEKPAARATPSTVPAAPASPGDEAVVFGLLVMGAPELFSGSSFSMHGSGSKLWAIAAFECDFLHHMNDPANATATLFGTRLARLFASALEERSNGTRYHLSIAFWADGSMGERFAVVAVACKDNEAPRTMMQNACAWPIEAFMGSHPNHVTAAQALRKLAREAAKPKPQETAKVPRRSSPKPLPKGEEELLALLQDVSAELPHPRAIAKRIACHSTDPRVAKAAATRNVQFLAKDLLFAAGRGVCAELLGAMCAATSDEELKATAKERGLSGALRDALAACKVTLPSPAAPVPVRKDDHPSPTSTEMAEAAQRSRQARREEVERKKALKEAERLAAAPGPRGRAGRAALAGPQ